MNKRQPNDPCPNCGYTWGHKWGCELENAEYAATLAEGAFRNEEYFHQQTRDELATLRAEHKAQQERIAELERRLDASHANGRDAINEADKNAERIAALEAERDALRAENEQLLGLLAYFVCHIPAKAYQEGDQLWQQMWNEASALVLDDGAGNAESAATQYKCRSCSFTSPNPDEFNDEGRCGDCYDEHEAQRTEFAANSAEQTEMRCDTCKRSALEVGTAIASFYGSRICIDCYLSAHGAFQSSEND